MSHGAKAVEIDRDGRIVTTSDAFGNKDWNLVTKDADYVGQSVQVRLRSIKGEWVFNPDFGLPWKQIVGVHNIPFLQGSVSDAALSDPDVASLASIEVDDVTDIRKRRVNVAVSVRTNLGNLATGVI